MAETGARGIFRADSKASPFPVGPTPKDLSGIQGEPHLDELPDFMQRWLVELVELAQTEKQPAENK